MTNVSKNNQDLRSNHEEIAFTNHRDTKNVEKVTGECVIPNNGKLSLQQKRALLAQLLQQKTSESKSVYSLSCGQQALWFLYQLAPESPAYNIMYAARVRSDLDILALQRAFGAVIERHPCLRTAYAAHDGSVVQQVHANQKVDIEVIDASTLSHEQLNERLAKETDRPFDLERGTVLRVNLFTASEREYILLLTVHHIASDFWSLEVLINELCLLYSAEKAGVPAFLPPLSLGYADYVRWQAEMLAGSEGERLWTYWQKQLSGMLPLLNLPTDRSRPPIQTYRGASHTFKLNEELTQQLVALAKAEGATLFMSLLAAFQVLLYHYTNQEDILVGSPTTGRSRGEFAPIVGYFANPVVLRADLSKNPTFKEFLAQVRSTVLGAIAHQDYPFPLLVERLCPQRDPSVPPLVQVMFVWDKPYQNKGDSEVATEINQQKLDLECFASEQRGAAFDLTLTMFDTNQLLSASLQYNTDLFEGATIARMIEHFQNLLVGIVTNPEQRLQELPLLSETEQRQLLIEWNATQVDYPKYACIHELFEAQVKRTPDAIALVFKEEQLTYSELNRRANQVAHHLHSLGIRPDGLVGICVERSPLMVVGLLGILKAGGAYVPLDPAYPLERLAFMLNDAQISVLLSQNQIVQKQTIHPRYEVCLDNDWKVITQQSEENPNSGVTPDHLAYVIYTSGSTGKPKGVMIPHQGLVNYVHWCSHAYAVTEGRGSVVHSSLAFDLTITSLFSSLLVGRSILLIPEDEGVEALGAALRTESDFSLVKITPAHLEVLSQKISAQTVAGRTKALIVGGEALFAQTLSFWQTYAPSTRLINEYGPTETVVGCCVYEVAAGVSMKGEVPIGRPIANVQIYILDSYLQPVPIGIPGELYISGDGLARGYFNRPDLTAERFIPNPFENSTSNRLYKTGDIARYLSDGNIEFLGRLDDQAKIRGFRIELGEIETVLSQHPAVRDTVVMVREDVPGNKCLVAYVVVNQVPAPTISQFYQFLKQKLPEYMVPSTIVLLESIPLTSNGKIDRRCLPPPENLRPQLEAAYVMPQTEVERLIATVWQEVLQLDKVGINDNFFELGGHSMFMIQIHSKLLEILEQELSIVEMFQYPTIYSLAKHLSQKQSEESFSLKNSGQTQMRSASKASMNERRQLRQKYR